MKVLELIDFDLKLSLKNQADLVIGVDEVGRGSLAGSVVCAAYSFNPDVRIINYSENLLKLDDSKKIKNKDRMSLVNILKNAIPASLYAIQENSVQYINSYGIMKAIFTAMARAVSEIIINFREQTELDSIRVLILVDGPKPIPDLDLYLKTDENLKIRVPQESIKIKQIAIKKGDGLSASIAAASNIAKDYRDRLMKELILKDTKLKPYSWDTNVGYGSLKHRKAILEHGLTRHHRISFCQNLKLPPLISPNSQNHPPELKLET